MNVNVVIDMDQVSRMRMRAAWFRDVPNIPEDAALFDWAADEIEGLRKDLREALDALELLAFVCRVAEHEHQTLDSAEAVIAKHNPISQEI
jgi:hypothetical protein